MPKRGGSGKYAVLDRYIRNCFCLHKFWRVSNRDLSPYPLPIGWGGGTGVRLGRAHDLSPGPSPSDGEGERG